MVSYIAKRIFAVIPIVLFAIFIMFVFIRLSPVDPAEAYLTAANIHPTEELLAEKRHEFGLDQPMVVQYVREGFPTGFRSLLCYESTSLG